MQRYHSRKRGDTAAKHSTYNINRPVTAGVLADLRRIIVGGRNLCGTSVNDRIEAGGRWACRGPVTGG
jgi:hypothetical protein